MIGRDLARAFDPALVMRDAGLPPDTWQADLLRSEAPRVLLLACRQSGKSTTVGAAGLHCALYEPGALVILVSPSMRQSQELFRKTLTIYHQLAGVPGLEAESTLRAELANGSRIISLPGSETTVRGYSGAAMIAIDEASRVDDELVAAVRPMLATTDGRLIMLTTPFGKRGVFHREWTEGGDAWSRVLVTAKDVPRISPAFLEEERRALGPLYEQEYECAFIEPDSAVFSWDIINAAFSPDVEPLWG